MPSGEDLAEQVQKALVAHGAWKVRLASAIETGTSEFTPESVRADDRCALGKWLYYEIDPALKAQPQYAAVRKLHADFHVAAAKVLELALSGHKAEAQSAMLIGQEFGCASTQLTIALSNWRDAK